MHGQRQREDRRPALPYRLILATAACGYAATALVFVFPAVRFAYHSPEFHIGLETAAGLTAGLAALLFYGRLRLTRSRSAWALVYALAVSALVNILLSVVPAIATDGSATGHFSQWAAMTGRLVAAAAFAYAAFAGSQDSPQRRHAGRRIAISALATIAFLSVAVRALQSLLPPAIDGGVTTAGPVLIAHPLVVAAQSAALLLFAAAAVGFFRKAQAENDELMRWLAAGALLAAFSRLHYALYPSLYADWVYTGDILRLGFYVMLLTGAVGEIRRYWQGLADAAAEGERRRLARELHDGVAQELAYIASQARRLQRHDGEVAEEARVLVGAADRALDESRRAIAALSREPDERLDKALAHAAEEAAARVGMSIRFDLDPSATVDTDTREALIRIAREAIINAGRHSQTDKVDLRLSNNGRVRLAVEDQGVGFDAEGIAADRFGLISMRERAQAIDAAFQIISSPGAGTTVEVELNER